MGGRLVERCIQRCDFPDTCPRKQKSTSSTPDIKRNRRLKVLVNPFSGKVKNSTHLNIQRFIRRVFPADPQLYFGIS